MLYDAISGLVALEKNDADSMTAIRRAMENFPKYGEFAGKDTLLNEFAAKAARAKDNVLLSNIINAFFPDYEDSPHAGEMYAARARLFYTTGRYNECMQDIAGATAKNPELAEELRYTNAQCMEQVDMTGALDLYRGMFASDEQYKLLSAVKIMDNTDDVDEVLMVADVLKADNPQLYLEGVRRFMELAEPADLSAYEAFVLELSESEDIGLQCAGLYGLARLLNEQERGRDAASVYYQVYEADPKDHFATPALDAAYVIYVDLGMDKEAGQIKTLIRKQ
jgi:tetratricopeptide (TPR) repeat protein